MTPFDHQQLDELIHSRIRLSVMAILAAVTSAEFTYLRDAVNTTDGNLGTHLRKLEYASYLKVEKTFVERKPVSRYSLTSQGRAAFRAYADRLAQLLARV